MKRCSIPRVQISAVNNLFFMSYVHHPLLSLVDDAEDETNHNRKICEYTPPLVDLLPSNRKIRYKVRLHKFSNVVQSLLVSQSESTILLCRYLMLGVLGVLPYSVITF